MESLRHDRHEGAKRDVVYHHCKRTGTTCISAAAAFPGLPAGKFADVQNAYEVLSDDSKRSAYNTYGHSAVDGSNGSGEGGPFGPGGPEGFMDAEELFAQFFGGAASRGGRGSRG